MADTEGDLSITDHAPLPLPTGCGQGERVLLTSGPDPPSERPSLRSAGAPTVPLKGGTAFRAWERSDRLGRGGSRVSMRSPCGCGPQGGNAGPGRR